MIDLATREPEVFRAHRRGIHRVRRGDGGRPGTSFVRCLNLRASTQSRNRSVGTGIECHVPQPSCLSYFSMIWSERWPSIETGSPSPERLRVSDPTKRHVKPYADSYLELGLSLFFNSWKDRVWRAWGHMGSSHLESDMGTALN